MRSRGSKPPVSRPDAKAGVCILPIRTASNVRSRVRDTLNEQCFELRLRIATLLYGVDRESMEIKRVDTQASAASSATASTVAAVSRDKPTGQEGPADWFTGKVWIEPLFEAPDTARIRCSIVTVEPCAGTAWH